MANICYFVLYDCMVNVREGEERDVSKDASFNSFIFPQEEQAGRQAGLTSCTYQEAVLPSGRESQWMRGVWLL